MRAIVAAGGEPLDEIWHTELPADALIVAADSGLAHVYALGRTPAVVVGDFDSVDPTDLARATREGARIDRHPADKDATDLQLALAAARELGATDVIVIGAGGGRLDHFMANLALLADPAWSNMRMVAFVDTARITVIRGQSEIHGAIGSLITLLAVGGPVTGVTTVGLRWRLTDDALDASSTRGVSNELLASPATITVRSGVLLAIQPTGGR